MEYEKKRIKILAIKLTSLRSQLKEYKEIANSASLEVDKMFMDKYYPEKPKTTPKNAATANKINEEHTSNHRPKENINTDPESKNIFRKIALKTHPDKLLDLNPSEREAKKELFRKASKAIEDNDFILLADIAGDLGLKVPQIPETELKKTLYEINAIKKELKHIESTYVWQWFFSFDPERKKQLLDKIFEILHERNKKQNPGP